MSGGFSRVSIPDSLRKTIQDIKEITGEHSDEDVYTVLKECGMDPNETAQKLLYLDTFHEVKKKRDRRKVSIPNRALEEYRRIPGMQRRGTKGGNYYSSYSSEDSVGGSQLNARHENGHRASKPSGQVMYKPKNKTPAGASDVAHTIGSTSIPNGSSSHDHSNRGVIRDNKADYINNSRNLPSLQTFSANQVPTPIPGPTPTPTPTISSTVTTGAQTRGGSMKSRSPSVSGLYSSESDPVLVPSLNYPVLVSSLNPRNPGPGIIKRQTGNQRNTADINANLVADSIRRAVQNVPTGQALSVSVDSSSSTCHDIASAKGDQESLKEMSSEAADVAEEDPVTKEETSEADTRLHVSANAKQSVIFPNHLHVPEAFKNILTFGSLDALPLGENNDSNPSNASVPTDVEASKGPSPPPQSSSSTSGLGDYTDPARSPPHRLVNISSSQENISSDKYDEPKQEMLQPVGRTQNPHLPPVPDYGLNPVPPVGGSHLVQLEGLDPQGGNSVIPSTTGSTPSMSQPRGIAQSSMPVSPELFPFIRPPYPPNYIPYSPYFSQLFMPPQNAPQLLGHSGFPQQPSAYMPPTAAGAASGVKFPMPPPVYKPGNLTHFGISSGYGSYGASLPPGTSSNEDAAGAELKEKNMYSTMKQNEDLHGLNSASGQANVLYNVPQGQPVAFSPAQVGPNSFPSIYHPNQSMSNPSLVQSTVEPMVPPMSSYPQPQSTPLLPLPQQQYAQMNWNQKLLNRDNM